MKKQGIKHWQVLVGKYGWYSFFIVLACADVLNIKSFSLGYIAGFLVSIAGWLFWNRVKIGKRFRYLEHYVYYRGIHKYGSYVLVFFGSIFTILMVFESNELNWISNIGLLISGWVVTYGVIPYTVAYKDEL